MIQRFINPSTEKLEYYWENREPCPPAVIDEVTGEERILYSKQTVGSVFGFLVPKRGHFIFKTENIMDNKPIRGQECASSTNLPPKKERLYLLGNVLKEANRGDFGLSKQGIGARPLKSAGRICTLTELVLRFMHVSAIEKKHWFFRPVKAALVIEQSKNKK